MKAKIRNTEIYFDVTGMHIAPSKDYLIEKPVLFLIHGGPGGNHIHFKYDSEKLQKYSQLVFIDQRGCGRFLIIADIHLLLMGIKNILNQLNNS